MSLGLTVAGALVSVGSNHIETSPGRTMAEQTWHEARLIPTSGISGADEQERRATSALLAVLGAVREFNRAVLRPLGAPAGSIECYIEVPFMLGDQRVFPDGLIRVSRGGRSWTTLVEVKTGSNCLSTEQLENYLDVAREQGFDALLTISNEIPAIAGHHPTTVDKRKLKKVELHHLAWSQVLAEAVLQKEFRGVADPDQAWILGELIRYLEHTRSGALEFDDMGDSWTGVRDAVAAGTLRAGDRGIPTVVTRFDALLRFASLKLGRRLGTEVVPALSRKEAADPVARAAALTHQLVSAGQLSGAIRIPNTAGHLVVTADVRAGQLECHVDVDAPREGRSTNRVNWLVRQLKNAPDAVRLECVTAHSRGASSADLLRTVRVDPACLVLDPRREIRSFRIAQTASLGTKRGRGRGSFIDSVLAGVDTFYGSVLGDLKAWSATPPRLRPERPAISVEEGVRLSASSTDVSSQDGPSPEPTLLTHRPRAAGSPTPRRPADDALPAQDRRTAGSRPVNSIDMVQSRAAAASSRARRGRGLDPRGAPRTTSLGPTSSPPVRPGSVSARSIGRAPASAGCVSTGATRDISRFVTPLPSVPRSVREPPGWAATASTFAPAARSRRSSSRVKSRFASLLWKYACQRSYGRASSGSGSPWAARWPMLVIVATRAPGV
ncbi:MAG: hypothetical protein ACRCYX_03485 [Dermatophilaceae bacterium]